MEFANELGLGTGNITSYGRTVYAIQLTKAATVAAALHRHAPAGQAQPQRAGGQRRSALTSYAYLESIAVEEYIGGGTEADAAEAQDHGGEGRRPALANKAKNSRRPAATTAPPAMTAMIKAIGHRQPAPDRAGPAGHHRRELVGGQHPQVQRLPRDRDGPGRQGGGRGPPDRRRRQARRVHHRRRRRRRPAPRVHPGRPLARQMSRAMRQLRNAAFGIAEQRLPMLVDQLSRTDPGRVDTRVQPIPINTRTRSARSPAPSTRSTARPSGSPPSRPCCGATSTRSSPTSRAATSR